MSMYFENVDFTEMHNQHYYKRAVAIDSLPQRTLCTLLKMMTILDDPLVEQSSTCVIHVF